PRDVGPHERVRGHDAAIDVRFGGEVEDRIDSVIGEHARDRGAIADVAVNELEPRVVHHTIEVREVTGVRERVQNDDLLEAGALAAGRQHATREVGADEAGASRDQEPSWLEAIHRRELTPTLPGSGRSTSAKVRHFTVQREVTL